MKNHFSRLAALAILLAASAFTITPARAATWNVNSSGNWTTAGNWSGTVPDAAGATASLTYDITAARTVTINITSKTVGTLQMGDPDYTYGGGWYSYTLAANAGLSLILDNGASSATIEKVYEYSTSGTPFANSIISAPVLLNSSLNILDNSRQPYSGNPGVLSFTTGGITANSAGTKTINNNGTGVGGVVISGVIGDGTGQIAVTQNSTTSSLTLNGTNTYSGNTLIQKGTLKLGNNLALQNSAADTSGGGNITLSGITTATIGGLIGSKNLSSVITTGYTGLTALTLNPRSGVTHDYSGVIANGSANMTLTKTGSGTQVLSGLNTYTGLTTVSEGTLAYGVTNSLSSGAVTVNGGTLDIKTFSDTVGVVTLTNGSVTGTSGVLTGSSYVFNGNGTASAILNGTGTATKSGAATTTTLSGNNTFTGATAVSSGTLELASASGQAALGGTASVTVGTGGTLLLSQNDQINNAATMTLGNGTIKFGAAVSEGGNSTVGVGALTLTANSILDFNSFAGLITFASFTPGAYILEVTNWLPTSSHLIFNQDQTANLAANAFTVNGQSAFQTDLGNGFYEIGVTAIPEPSTWVAIGALVLGGGLIAWNQRRFSSDKRKQHFWHT